LLEGAPNRFMATKTLVGLDPPNSAFCFFD
jgi:hypothetical protein